MKKEFIPYEQALELKQLGFDEPCFKYIYVGDTGNNYDHFIDVQPSKSENFNKDLLCISQPTFSQAFRFFRDKKLCDSCICRYQSKTDGGIYYYYVINKDFGIEETKHFKEGFLSYEEAEDACLQKLIEIAKQK